MPPREGIHPHPGEGRSAVSMSSPTLLVVEDAGDQAILVGVAARRCHPGLRVRTAYDGFQGAAYLAGVEPFADREEHPLPDLVILDLFMPEVDGFALLSWLRKRPVLAAIPVVVLTSSGNPHDESRARWLGARMVYRKPTDLDELGGVVREIVGLHIPRTAMLDAHLTRGG